MKGKYKNHSFEVITSKSIYELMEICPYTDEDVERIETEMQKVIDEGYEILKKNKLTDGWFPIVFKFESDSKKIYEQIIQNKETVEDLDEYIECELDTPTKTTDELDQYVVDKMGGDLVKWDTGFIGYVGYDNYGACNGLEIIPVNTR